MEYALAGDVQEAEALVSESQSMRVRIYQQEVEELVSSTGSGIGIRVFCGSAVGYAYASDLSDESLAATAAAARANAAVTAPDEFAGLPETATAFPKLDLYSEKLMAVPVADKIRLAQTVERTGLERDSRISQVESATYAEVEGSVALVNSRGFARGYRESTCYAFLQAIAEQEGQMQTGMSFTTGRDPSQLEAEFCGREAADRALALLGGSQCQSMTCPVVMDPFVTSSVIGLIGSVLTGEAVQKKRSMFAEKEGQQVASTLVRLSDDGTHPEGMASAPFDGEGVPTRETVLIDNGILQGFLYDAYTGRKAGLGSTGNGIRGSYRSMPQVGATNLRLTGGSQSPEEMISSIELGFYVMDVTGIHSGANAISGDFSVGAFGRIIRNGQLAEPVREVTIAGNLLAMLGAVEAVGNDNRWVPFGGSIHAPSLLIREMTVSGK